MVVRARLVDGTRHGRNLGATSATASVDGAPPSFASCDAATLAFYAEHASTYAETTWSLPVDHRLRAFADLAPASGAIVDVGCGAGRDLAAFQAAGRLVIGVERSAALARIAAERSSSPVVVADLAAVPLPPRSVGGVWASASLLHLPRAELPRAVASLAASLVRGGALFVSLKRGEGAVRGSDGRLFTLHTEGEVEEVITRCGLEILDRRVDADRIQRGGQGWISFVARSS